MSEPAKVFEDRAIPGEWRVEWLDDDGRAELEIFTGPGARGVRSFQGSTARAELAALVGRLSSRSRCPSAVDRIVWCKALPHQVPSLFHRAATQWYR